MSFRTHARRVRNPVFPCHVRLHAFRSCIGVYCWTGNGRSFTQIWERYSAKFGLNEADLMSAMDALQTERNLELEKLRLYERRRIRAKAKGRRVPSWAEKA